MARIVAEGILAVLKELDRLAEIGAAVHPGKKSLHHVPRAEIEP
jgi:hypothetical protein